MCSPQALRHPALTHAHSTAQQSTAQHSPPAARCATNQLAGQCSGEGRTCCVQSRDGRGEGRARAGPGVRGRAGRGRGAGSERSGAQHGAAAAAAAVCRRGMLRQMCSPQALRRPALTHAHSTAQHSPPAARRATNQLAGQCSGARSIAAAALMFDAGIGEASAQKYLRPAAPGSTRRSLPAKGCSELTLASEAAEGEPIHWKAKPPEAWLQPAHREYALPSARRHQSGPALASQHISAS